MTISFEFDAPVSGSYQLKVNNEPYVCEVLPKFPNRYYCYGPGKQNTRLDIRLMDENTGKLIFCKSDSAPICQPTAVPGNKDTTCVPKTPQQCRDLLKDPAAEWWQPTCSCIIVN